MFTLRFDMRAPQPGAPAADLYSTALGMCAWSETRGCAAVVACEHHGSPDGYLPAPLLLASAVAARTERLRILVAALLLPFYDVVRLAEDMNVLDLISRGRVSYVLGIGYRPEEFEHLGVDRSRRGQLAEERLRLLLRLRTGEEVVHEGRRIRVTPAPFTPGGPDLLWGGGSIAAADRAGRFGLGLQANASVPGMREAYEAACRANGHEPSFVHLPDRSEPSVVFVADDVERAWRELGHHMLHDARMYSAWNPGDDSTAFITHAASVDELRSPTSGYRILHRDDAVEQVRSGGALRLAPLCGGIPPELAWPYLERAAEAVAAATMSPIQEERPSHAG
ncbi:MAG TPA: LLM class flavin-dependent oxidoreductase [Acidimicrobiales bacterium]|nr:LLM class flavin-dependent oxidoreductase [Acidimicrobiales bacterium]